MRPDRILRNKPVLPPVHPHGRVTTPVRAIRTQEKAMADQDRYSSDDNRDRLGQRDVYMDNRTGVGAQGRGYRAEWGRGEDQDRGRYGDREQNYNQRRGENASFSDRDYGQSD